jgi:hypothetical protein
MIAISCNMDSGMFFRACEGGREGGEGPVRGEEGGARTGHLALVVFVLAVAGGTLFGIGMDGAACTTPAIGEVLFVVTTALAPHHLDRISTARGERRGEERAERHGSV